MSHECILKHYPNLRPHVQRVRLVSKHADFERIMGHDARWIDGTLKYLRSELAGKIRHERAYQRGLPEWQPWHTYQPY